jgi:hypothetical protein
MLVKCAPEAAQRICVWDIHIRRTYASEGAQGAQGGGG